MEIEAKIIIIEKLIKLIIKYSDNSWSWKFISSNPNITMEVIEKIMINLGIGMKFQLIHL